MMRAGAAILLVAVAGCGGAAGDACAGHEGSCLGLRVEGSGAIDEVDQLAVKISGVAHLDGKTPPGGPGKVLKLPVTTALYLPEVSGTVNVEVTGLLGGSAVGSGARMATVSPKMHQTIVVVLAASSDGGMDDIAGPPADLASDMQIPDMARDFSMGQPDFTGTIVDLSMPPADMSVPPSQDLSMVDLKQPTDLVMVQDLVKAPADMATSPDMVLLPRKVFLAAATTGNINFMAQVGVPAADLICSTTAGAQPGRYKALLGTSNGTAPNAHVSLPNGSRPIVLPSGKQVATDATFWMSDHLAAIDQRWDQSPAAQPCVWTTFSVSGSNGGAETCNGWSNINPMGGTGLAAAADAKWAVDNKLLCNTLCHFYCIEQ